MLTATVFLPLIGALLAGLFGRNMGDRAAQYLTCGLMLLAAFLSVILFAGFLSGSAQAEQIQLFTWINSGAFEISWALRLDALTAVMLVVVNGVSSMVHVYSIGYMSHDKSISRFMAYLSLFTFFMLMLVTADNFLQLFFGWEGVGLASYLLIGFWYEKPAANAAAMKAFIVNRVGDFGFALGIFAIFMLFGSAEFDIVFAATPDHADSTLSFLWFEGHALTIICLLLFVGAMGKSAQLGLHTWLPDAMEGPTPVSALIHAATMVTAGVFMICRLSPLFEYAPDALMVVAIVGAATAFFAATVAITQNDIKRVIAYSTCSQLGYMFFAIGVSAYSAAMFHLFTHAFFKALLFLGAGSVIHAMSDEQDMRRMGGIWRQVKVTYALMLIGSLALAGIGIPGTHIGFAGFLSKDIMLEAAYADHSWFGLLSYVLGALAALMTAFYSWRLLIMTFHGKPRADEKVMARIHESPPVMLIPLMVLALGAALSGMLFYDQFVGPDYINRFWQGALLVLPANDSVAAAHHVPFIVKALPLIMGVVGIALAYWIYMLNLDLPAKLARHLRPLYDFSFNKWYFDALYDRVFVRPCRKIALWLWHGGDEAVIDRFGPNGIAETALVLARRASTLQSGYVYHYAFAMMIGVVVLISWTLL